MSNPPPRETPIPPPVIPTHSFSSIPASRPPPAPAPTTTSAPEPTMPPAPTADVPMRDANEPASSPAPAPHTAPSPAPGARYGTPNRGLNNGDGGPSSSRAGSVHPEASNLNLPSHPTSHGDTARMYINNNVTSVLLEGMKIIGKDQPDSPLKVLGEFLLQKSREKGEPGSVN